MLSAADSKSIFFVKFSDLVMFVCFGDLFITFCQMSGLLSPSIRVVLMKSAKYIPVSDVVEVKTSVIETISS